MFRVKYMSFFVYNKISLSRAECYVKFTFYVPLNYISLKYINCIITIFKESIPWFEIIQNGACRIYKKRNEYNISLLQLYSPLHNINELK